MGPLTVERWVGVGAVGLWLVCSGMRGGCGGWAYGRCVREAVRKLLGLEEWAENHAKGVDLPE
jgi:hypothetical protein